MRSKVGWKRSAAQGFGTRTRTSNGRTYYRPVSLRGQLKSVKILLEETRISPENAVGLAERLQELKERVEQQPQLSAVRPAAIALRNLIVSLRRPELSTDLTGEIEIAIESLRDLLADDTFGIGSDDRRAQIAKALNLRDAHACAACKHADLTIEPVYILMKPFPSDSALAPSELPCALVVCKRCGFMWMHDLAVLGVL